MTLTVILGSLLILPFLGIGSTEQDSLQYSILAPKAFRVSSVYKVTATVYNVPSTVQLTFRLESDGGVLVEGQESLQNGVTKIVSLQVPDIVPETSYTFYVEGTGGLVFNNSHSVSITRKTLSIFVQTDKAMYKPGQKVLFRAIVVQPDLKPYQGLVDIEVFDQSSNKIMQWKDQQSDTGVISKQLQLSDQTPLGDWQIVANAGGNTFTKGFQVDEYVLPKFEVAVSLPTYFLLNTNNRDLQDDLHITVTTKYTYGQPVKGRATITFQVKPYDWDNSNYTKKVMDVQLVNGKADVTLAIKDLLSLAPTPNWYYDGYTPDPWNQLAYRSLLVVADVNEQATGIDLSGNATVDIKTDKYQLQFLDFSPSNYKPGLLYTAFFQLSQADGSAPDLADITLPGGAFREISVQASMEYPPVYDPDYSYVPPTIEFINVTITPTGIMSFSLMIDSNVTSVSFQPSFYVSLTNSTIYGYKSINAFKSRDNQTIQISFNSDDGLIKSNQNAVFTIKTTDPISVFQYEVMGKGNILLSDNVVGAASTEHSLSIFISNDMAQASAPNLRVLVWFVTEFGEIVADSTEVSISDVFANKVSLSFDRESTTPAENASLTINAYPGSYVGLLAVDQSVLLLKSGNDITQEMVTEDLSGYDSVQEDYFGPIWMFRRRRRRSIWWPRIIDGSDTSSIIDKAGLFCLTNGFIYVNVPIYRYPFYAMRPNAGGGPEMGAAGPPVDDGPGAKGADAGQPTDKPRVNFPETWLWTEETTGPDGKVTIQVTAPDTMTSWVASCIAISPVAGLGVAADTAKLTVFKPFFISPNLPYSVIRGEEIALQVTVFNYLKETLDVSVTLKESNYYKVQGSTSRNVQVNSNDAVSVYFWIIPGGLGQIPIEISAQSPVAGDSVIVMLLVKPEGIQQQYSTSAFIQLSSSGSSYNLSLPVSLPPEGTLVPGSEYIELTCIGDLMGPSVKGLDNLLQMPGGCGEQNMLGLAPDVYIVKYLSIAGQLTVEIETKAIGYMNSGYQTELTYQRSDFSFSAFGNSDPAGSLWLTSFVVDVLKQADAYIPVEDGKLAQAIYWIIANQAANGSFAEPPEGRVIHTDMQGGSSRGLALTAYVFIALLHNRNNSLVNADNLTASIKLAREYLEDQLSSVASDPYALSIISYAFSLAHSSKLNESLQLLEELAVVEAGTKHWEKPADEVGTDSPWSWQPPYSQARAINIEMTSYVLRTYSQLGNIERSLPIAKWIIAQRNANGGFSSTQDTVVALAALADFAALILGPATERNLQVSLATTTEQYSFTPITDETALLLQSYELPSDTKEVFVSARGRGAVLVQLNVRYNVFETEGNSAIDLGVNTTQNGNQITIRLCSRWRKKEGSGMVLMEVYQLTGFEPSNRDDLRKQNKNIKRDEYKDGVLVLYFDELTSDEICLDVKFDKVFPVSKLKDAPIKVYPYYDPSEGNTISYSPPEALSQTSACEECPQCCDENSTKTTSNPIGSTAGNSDKKTTTKPKKPKDPKEPKEPKATKKPKEPKEPKTPKEPKVTKKPKEPKTTK